MIGSGPAMKPLLVYAFSTMIDDHEAHWDGQDRDCVALLGPIRHDYSLSSAEQDGRVQQRIVDHGRSASCVGLL